MQKADPLIRTKLRLPFTRPELVPRPRLQEQIAQGLRGPLTLITAPAGFGKTTLVTSCVAGCGMPVAWLSLDKNDNQIGRFQSYLLAALQEADPKVGEEAAQLLAAQQPLPEAVLTSLINDLDENGREIALVLDDYHVINNLDVHSAVSFLLEHCPRTLHLVIASRSDPLIPLTRLRGRGQAIELRGNDLRFTRFEAAQYLNEIMSLGLDDRWVAVLEERTEGWIAGLQMAALSIRDRENVGGFIEGFCGTNRYILDYLLEEVLASQPPEIQHFLLCTSILDRMIAPLCEAVLEADQSEGWIVDKLSASFQPYDILNCQAILEHLEQANLFLVPLDDDRQWYRYHHLFADLLRARLDQLYPGFARQYHASAAAWFEREGVMVEAVNHTLAAGEHDRAAWLVEENTTRLLAQGELNSLMGWIEALPAALRQSRPWLCIHQAYALAFAGRMGEVPPLLDQAEAILRAAAAREQVIRSGESHETYIPPAGESEPLSIDEGRSLGGSIAGLRAMAAVMVGQDAEAIPHALLARELLPANSLNDRIAVAWALGYALHSQGRLDEACAAFKEQTQLGRAMDHPWAVLAGQTYLAQVLQAQGQLHQAHVLLKDALAEASQRGASSRGYIAFVEANLARVLYEQNELEAANLLLDEAMVLIQKWPNPNFLVFTHALLARVLLAQGDLQEARTSISEADRVSRSAALTRLDQRWVEADLVRVWLAFRAAGVKLVPGDALKEQANTIVAAWRSELASPAGSNITLLDKCAEIAALTLARVSLAAGRAEETLSQLEVVTRSARDAGHIETAINSLALTAVACQVNSAQQIQSSGSVIETEQSVPALSALEEALCMAEPGGYIRVFLDEGSPMQRLLKQWLVNAGDNPLRIYVVHLLSQFDSEIRMDAAALEKDSPASSLIEPLSQRELEVLNLLSLGMTNQEIAGQLVVSPGTVKAHTASIYRKLDVANRTEATARARQLSILP
jgi:LuxR family maltose regulon positive regulatory protein